MSNVNININEAAVTAVKEFRSSLGYGVDFYIEACSSNGTVYLQVVAYDEEARSYSRAIHQGDCVRVTGDLKVKVYPKKDGTAGCSLLIERPKVFTRITCSNSEQTLRDTSDNSDNAREISDAVTASAETASAVPAFEGTASADTASAETASAVSAGEYWDDPGQIPGL